MDAIEQLFASHAAERKAAVLEFTPDEIRITAENKFDDGIYQLLYDVWKKTSGEYDPKDDKPIVDPRGNTTTKNETKFKYWAMEQYGMTAEEYRGYTVDGAKNTILEAWEAKDKVLAILSIPKLAKNIVKDVTKDTTNSIVNNAPKVINKSNIKGYQSNGRMPDNLLLNPNLNKKGAQNLTEWRRQVRKSDIHTERIKFVGENAVKVEKGVWRSLDGTRQFRVVPSDYLGKHPVGRPPVNNVPHIHFEFLTLPNQGGNKLKQVKNIHVPLI